MSERKLFVGNLSFKTTEEEIFELLGVRGVLADTVNIITNRETGQSRGFAFIGLSADQDVDEAIRLLNGSTLSGRDLTVNLAQPKSSSRR